MMRMDFLWKTLQTKDIPFSFPFFGGLKPICFSFCIFRINPFFNKKDRRDLEVIRLSKFRSSFGQFFKCVVWPSNGGRMNIHVSASFDKKGWLVFWEIIRDSLINFDELNPNAVAVVEPFYQLGKFHEPLFIILMKFSCFRWGQFYLYI